MVGPLQLTADVLEFGYGVLAFLVGLGVLALAPGRRVNQTLAWLLIVDGLGLGGMASNMKDWDWAGPKFQAGAEASFVLGWALVVPLYLLFTAYALKGNVSAWLRTRAGKVAMTAIVVVQLALAFRPGGLLENLGSGRLGLFTFAGPLVAAGVVGLVAAVQNLRQASGIEHRRQARAYLLAFAIRDAAYILGYSVYVATFDTLDWSEGSALGEWWLIFIQVSWLLFLMLLVYGILSGKMLDLDRRVRTLAARMLALGFVAVFFIVITESVERFLNVSNPLVGIGAAVVLAFVFKPVEHGLEAGARRILPTEPVSVAEYRRAVDHALADGRVTAKEKRLLDDLTSRLEVDRQDRR